MDRPDGEHALALGLLQLRESALVGVLARRSLFSSYLRPAEFPQRASFPKGGLNTFSSGRGADVGKEEEVSSISSAGFTV